MNPRAFGSRIGWLHSVRSQLILGVALVFAVMMSLFVWDLTVRQQAMLLERQTEHAEAMAASMAVSTAGWLAARDIAGLQEIIDAHSRYPELDFAMLLDHRGHVLAHSKHELVGRYVRDLPSRVESTVVSRTAQLVDVYQPVLLGENVIGWVRVGIGQRVAANRLADITRDGLLYGLVAILISSLMAAWLGARLTRKLYAIRQVAESVRAGGERRVPPLGQDEVGALAEDFNAMLDTLHQRDVEIARASRETAASEARQRTLINAIPDLVWLKDPAGVYLACNPRFEHFFGATEAQIQGRTDYDFIKPEQADMFRENDRKAMAGDAPRVNEEWITFTNDGHRELVETIKAPLRNLDGELTGVLGIARDITQRKQNEELQRYAAFQSGVAEMGVSVLHNIGNAVTAMASDAEAVRQASEDIGRVSTLLEKSASDSVARQATGALADSELARLQAIQREAASAIVNLNTQGLLARSQRISESVQHISDIVRIQQSAALPSATASAFDLRQTVRNALSMQGDSLNQHGIHIEVEIDPALTLVTLSHNHLLQALVNVVKNAYEAIRQRQQQETLVGQILLRADVLDADWMRISVTDNGIGFTPEQQVDLFRFGYSTKARGSGFGLHATALFVQELGGRIALESPGLNQGARLIMELPRKPLASNLAGATDARQVEKPE